MDETLPSQSSREKTAPFLIRAFVKVGAFHRLQQIEDGPLPTTDETQIFTWKDATLREVLTTIRDTAPHIAEYRHPLARFSFRTVYADATNRGHFTTKELGQVYSRDILGEPGTLTTIAPKLLEDDISSIEPDKEREEKTLEELKLVPGDYLLVAIFLPKNVTAPSEQPRAAVNGAVGWKSAALPRTDSGWSGGLGTTGANTGRGGGHWRGESNGSSTRGRGRGGLPDRDGDRDRDEDSRIPPPRRGERGHSPPPPRGAAWGRRGSGGRGGRGGRRSRSRSRSRSPPPPRRRYD